MNPTPSLELRHIALRVPDLARSVGFYAGRLGFVVTAQDAHAADLATAREAGAILTLQQDAAATSAPRSAAGLFHVALLLPSRAALGAWLRRADAQGVEFDGFSDHGVSEAIYLSDPDGNGLEFYADRPPSDWPWSGSQIEMTTRPLDLARLLEAGERSSSGSLTDALWGHLHLRVTDLARSEEFYRKQLGVAVTQRSYPGARFLAADHYHHHLGLNTWGNPTLPQPPGAFGLAAATFASSGETVPRTLKDPDGIALRLLPSRGEITGST